MHRIQTSVNGYAAVCVAASGSAVSNFSTADPLGPSGSAVLVPLGRKW